MKRFIFILCLIPLLSLAETGTLIGKVVHVPKKGHFLMIEVEKKQYAYPFDASNVKELKALRGKTIKAYFESDFRKSESDNSQYFMYLKLIKATELNLKSLGVQADDEIQVAKQPPALKNQLSSDKFQAKGLSNKIINSALFVGGALLAADVLQNLAKSQTP